MRPRYRQGIVDERPNPEPVEPEEAAPGRATQPEIDATTLKPLEPEWVEHALKQQTDSSFPARPPEHDRCSKCYGVGYLPAEPTPAGLVNPTQSWRLCRPGSCHGSGKAAASSNDRSRQRPTEPYHG